MPSLLFLLLHHPPLSSYVLSSSSLPLTHPHVLLLFLASRPLYSSHLPNPPPMSHHLQCHGLFFLFLRYFSVSLFSPFIPHPPTSFTFPSSILQSLLSLLDPQAEPQIQLGFISMTFMAAKPFIPVWLIPHLSLLLSNCPLLHTH